MAGAAAIHVINRNEDRGAELVRTIVENTPARADYLPWRGTAAIPVDTDILINATCVGLFPDVDA